MFSIDIQNISNIMQMIPGTEYSLRPGQRATINIALEDVDAVMYLAGIGERENAHPIFVIHNPEDLLKLIGGPDEERRSIEALKTALSNLAGAGRTTETVKGNADAIAQANSAIASLTQQSTVLQKQAIPVVQEGTTKKYVGVNGATLYIGDGVNLYKSTDRGITQTLVNAFATTVDKVVPLASGALLMITRATDDACIIYRSADGETSWSQVASLSVGYLEQAICQDSVSGKIYLGSYVTSGTTGDIYCSDDDGVTWSVVKTIADVRHIHFIVEDDINPGTLYLGTGDSDTQSMIIKSTDGFATYEVVGSGAQLWRSVAMLFTETYLWWAMDSTTSGAKPHIVRMNRTTGVVEQVLQLNAPGYYALKTAAGELLFATTPENAVTTTKIASNIYYSPDGGISWGILYSHDFDAKGFYIIYIAGQTTDGVIYISQRMSGTVRYNMGMKIVEKALINTPWQTIEPIKLYYSLDANGKSINNILRLTGKSGSIFHVSATGAVLYLGWLNDSNGVNLSHRGTDHLGVDSNGVSLKQNGGGIIFRSANGTKYKLTVNDSGEAVFTLVP